MLGFIVAFWAAPHMTVAHLIFSIATTACIVIALQLEEHGLRRVSTAGTDVAAVAEVKEANKESRGIK